jgi:dTDP-4-dehydrorhamnose reductase
MTSFLILGGSGILGSEVIRSAQRKGLDYVAPRSSDLDIRNKSLVDEFVSNFKPNWIVNCAAWTDVEGAEDSTSLADQLNAQAVGNLAAAALKNGSSLIHFSTDYVFDGISTKENEVSDMTNPINEYGASKLKGEQQLLSSELNSAYVVRTSWLYGVEGKNFVKTMARKALIGESVHVVDDQIGSPTSARDLAAATFEIVNVKPETGIYHFTNEGSCSWYEFAREIFRLSGASVEKVKPIHSDVLKLKARRPKNSVLSTKKWQDSSMSKIPKWQDSLEVLFPEILAEIEREKLYGNS